MPYYGLFSRELHIINLLWRSLCTFRQKPISEWILMIPELDLSQISHECTARMRDLAEIQCRDFINQDPLTRWILFLSCDVFFQYISSRIVYF